MSGDPDILTRLLTERPDLFRRGMRKTTAGAIILRAVDDLDDNGRDVTPDAVMAWVHDHYPDRRPQTRGRPRLSAEEVHRRYVTAVRELRKDGRPPTNDADVADHLKMESDRQISEWRTRFGIPHVRDVQDE